MDSRPKKTSYNGVVHTGQCFGAADDFSQKINPKFKSQATMIFTLPLMPVGFSAFLERLNQAKPGELL